MTVFLFVKMSITNLAHTVHCLCVLLVVTLTSVDLYAQGARASAPEHSTAGQLLGSDMNLINQLLLMMAGSKADTKYMTDEAFPKATNAKNKELYVIDGATHIQTYWKPEYVTQAINKLVGFYQSDL